MAALSTNGRAGSSTRWLRLVPTLALVFFGLNLPFLEAAETSVPGLQLWLDAANEASVRELPEREPAKQRASISCWRDQSSERRHARQVQKGHRPQLLDLRQGNTAAAAPVWVMRFDGENDYLRILDVDLQLKSLTLYLVAAPHSNAGGYRGLFAFNEEGKRDYETGLNSDLNSAFSADFNNLNVEGRGFGGARNLRQDSVPFGTLQIIEVIVDAEAKEVRVSLDGQPSGRRETSGQVMIADEFTIGARHYNNLSAFQDVQGFFDGDIAEIQLYDRVLTDSERTKITGDLQRKHAELKSVLRDSLEQDRQKGNRVPLVTVENPPAVQMLVPGFDVQPLPIEINNINNVRFRPDGKVYALGYNGKIWLLSDSDDDGLEDQAELFFANDGQLRGPIGMAVIPARHALLTTSGGGPDTAGVVVASKGKVSAILDLDGDDVADKERIIADGWQEIPQNVDAIGVAIDPSDGAIYFGLGTAAYNNAYLLDEDGQAQFGLASERGTIQRITPDLSARTTVCTGVRFTIGMEFNRDGELLVTEQEGATWLPHGNPFDELLHIQPGRHYGFPPRHPQHLPNVFDEPSLFDYGPQHQSTCGMAINEPFKGSDAIFGPRHWQGDAIVTGESRGKLYRTQIVKDSAGRYVAQNHLIAALTMLTVDCCLTPTGDLLVACHSGGPDWGTGPTGIGKLYRIRYRNAEVPQPISTWAARPREIRVAFDRPLDLSQMKDLAERSRIEFGPYVAAADRYETIRPGYAVTEMQMAAPRFELPIYSAAVTSDRRTLILSTDVHREAVSYALTLPNLANPQERKIEAGEKDLRDRFEHDAIDLAYSLDGIEVEWKGETEDESWIGWVPHLDLSVSEKLLPESFGHKALWQSLSKPGTLRLSTRIDVHGLFLPATQPGSGLGFDLSDDDYVQQRLIRLSSTQPFSIAVGRGGESVAAKRSSTDDWIAEIPFAAEETTALVTVTMPTDESTKPLQVDWIALLKDGRSRQGSLALHRFRLPWADFQDKNPDTLLTREIPELEGGNWGRGRRVFFSDEAGCAKCHLADTNGYAIGPDLSNLIHRDYASVLRDVQQPSFAINPDYVTYKALLKDGHVLTGALRNEDGKLWIGDKDGKVTELHRDAIEQLEPSSVSVMPQGIDQTLGTARMKDLLTFLLRNPPAMPLDSPLPPPPPRSPDEIEAALAGSDPRFSEGGQPGLDKGSSESLEPIQILLVAGTKDHGPGEHDYPAWLDSWSQLLPAAPGVTVDTAMGWPSDQQMRAADTIVFYQKGQWNDERAEAIDAHLARGGGLVYIHWAIEGGPNAPRFAKRIGLASDSRQTRYRHGPLELHFTGESKHPIARNFTQLDLYDESYWSLRGDPGRLRPFAWVTEEGERRPLFWTVEPSKGRVFVSVPGHYSWTFDDPLYRVLLLRGIAWSADQPVDRFNMLVLPARP